MEKRAETSKTKFTIYDFLDDWFGERFEEGLSARLWNMPYEQLVLLEEAYGSSSSKFSRDYETPPGQLWPVMPRIARQSYLPTLSGFSREPDFETMRKLRLSLDTGLELVEGAERYPALGTGVSDRLRAAIADYFSDTHVPLRSSLLYAHGLVLANLLPRALRKTRQAPNEESQVVASVALTELAYLRPLHDAGVIRIIEPLHLTSQDYVETADLLGFRIDPTPEMFASDGWFRPIFELILLGLHVDGKVVSAGGEYVEATTYERQGWGQVAFWNESSRKQYLESIGANIRKKNLINRRIDALLRLEIPDLRVSVKDLVELRKKSEDLASWRSSFGQALEALSRDEELGLDAAGKADVLDEILRPEAIRLNRSVDRSQALRSMRSGALAFAITAVSDGLANTISGAPLTGDLFGAAAAGGLTGAAQYLSEAHKAQQHRALAAHYASFVQKS